jgi:hypothetical protein
VNVDMKFPPERVMVEGRAEGESRTLRWLFLVTIALFEGVPAVAEVMRLGGIWVANVDILGRSSASHGAG